MKLHDRSIVAKWLRRSGGRARLGEETTRSPIVISPAVGSMKPATRRSAVVLPQPDGPSSVTNSPSATEMLKAGMILA